MRDNERCCINCVEGLSSGPAFELKKELLQLIHGFILLFATEKDLIWAKISQVLSSKFGETFFFALTLKMQILFL